METRDEERLERLENIDKFLQMMPTVISRYKKENGDKP